MDKDFLQHEMAKKDKDVQPEKAVGPEPAKDIEVDYKERYGTLRKEINNSKSVFKSQMFEIKDLIEKRKEELVLLEHKLYKLEGAIEASDLYLKTALPSNVKK